MTKNNILVLLAMPPIPVWNVLYITDCSIYKPSNDPNKLMHPKQNRKITVDDISERSVFQLAVLCFIIVLKVERMCYNNIYLSEVEIDYVKI